MSNRDAWHFARRCIARDHAVMLVTLVDVRGSAPREVGASLAVSADALAGSIGGGRLEWEACETARGLLDQTSHWQRDTVVLNADIGQCCGGKVQLLYERLEPSDAVWLGQLHNADYRGSLTVDCTKKRRQRRWQEGDLPTALHTAPDATAFRHVAEPGTADVILFGAGHIGSALAPLLATLPFRLQHIDSREAARSAAVDIVDPPECALHGAPAGSLVLIMTHDHGLDYRIAETALTHPSVGWVGLVGSAAKRHQLSRRLHRTLGPEHATAALARLSCPIGRRIASRSPGEMAAVIAAELLYARDAHRAASAPASEVIHA